MLRVWWQRMRYAFWSLPLALMLLSAVIGLSVTILDQQLEKVIIFPGLFGGGPEGARSLLGAIITSMISFTGLVFSITIVVLSLTSSQFSPRVLRTFLNDRFVQFTLGVFVGTFVYAMLVLRSVRGTATADPFVPQLAMTGAILLVGTSLLVFLFFINHIAQAIRVATIIDTIGRETRTLLERRIPRDPDRALPGPQFTGPARLVGASGPGVIHTIDDDRLLELAEEHGCGIQLLRAVGEFLPEDAPLLTVYGADPPDDDELRGAISTGRERTMIQDVGFGMRQLVDIAERALSPGINDPTTAVQVVDELHDLLRRIACRPLIPRRRATEDGRVAVDIPGPGFAEYLDLAVEEIARWGEDAARVQDRLRGMLVDLYQAARPENRPVIEARLAQWGAAFPQADLDPEPTDAGLRPSVGNAPALLRADRG